MQQIHYYAQPLGSSWYRPKRRERIEQQTVAKNTVCVRLQNSNEIINIDLDVPALSPSEFLSTNIINVTYYVLVCNLFLWKISLAYTTEFDGSIFRFLR